jgi:peptide/nickel transport system substrate-binding protein
MVGAVRRARRTPALLLAAAAAAAVLASCGGGEPEQRAGGAITATIGGFPVLDPGIDYSYEGSSAFWNVYLPLLTYRRASGIAGTQLIPALAEHLPRITDGGRRYDLQLRSGLRYADGTAVRASDFEHTIQRALHLESAATSFFQGIVGADAYLRAGRARADIRGITADDATGRITIRLTAPDSTFPYALASTTAGLVPGDTPFTNQSAHPAPGTGPLRIASVTPSRAFVLERNPAYRQLPGIPAAKLDRIAVRLVQSPEREAQDVLRNATDLSQDTPPGEQLREARTEHADRYREEPANYTYYLFLNTQEPPFDDLAVRQAVNVAVDKRAVARLDAGLLRPSCNFLPENVPGHVAIDPCPYGDPDGAPDLARARRLVQQAGAEGARVRVWGPANGPQNAIATYVAGVLDDIGLDARLRTVDESVYFDQVTARSTHAQIGVFNWIQDFPHPSNFLFLFASSTIQPTHNLNLSLVRDGEIDAGLDRLARTTDPSELAREAAALDRRIVERAYVVPLGEAETTVLASDRVDLEHCSTISPIYGVDLADVCLRR